MLLLSSLLLFTAVAEPPGTSRVAGGGAFTDLPPNQSTLGHKWLPEESSPAEIRTYYGLL